MTTAAAATPSVSGGAATKTCSQAATTAPPLARGPRHTSLVTVAGDGNRNISAIGGADNVVTVKGDGNRIVGAGIGSGNSATVTGNGTPQSWAPTAVPTRSA